MGRRRGVAAGLAFFCTWLLTLSLVHVGQHHCSHDADQGHDTASLELTHDCVLCLAQQTLAGSHLPPPPADWQLPAIDPNCGCPGQSLVQLSPPDHSPDALRGPPALLQ